MEPLLVLLGIALVVGLPVGAVMGMIAWSRVGHLTKLVDELKEEVERLRRRPSVPPSPSIAKAPTPNVEAKKAIPVTAKSATAVSPMTVYYSATVTAMESLDLQKNISSSPVSAALTEEKPLVDTAEIISIPRIANDAPNKTSELPITVSASDKPEVVTPASISPLIATLSAATKPPSAKSDSSATASPPSPPSTEDIWFSSVVPPEAKPAPSSTTFKKAVERNKPATTAWDFEAVVGKRWLTWCGIALVFLSGVFLLKYAYDQDWLGHYVTPPMRVGGIAIAAVLMVIGGLRLLRQGMTALGHGLAGGGIAVAYLAVYGGFSPAVMLVPEPLFPGKIAFVLMAVITACGMTLAVRANALALAVCAVLGGFATPILIDTGGGSRDALFAYVLLLDLGVLGAAWFRRWRTLDVLAFAGTVVLYVGWHHSREMAGAEPWGMITWLSVFHLIFLLLPFAYHWRTRTAVTIERFALAVGNLAFTLAYAAILLRAEHQTVLALICLGLAGIYAVIGALTRARISDDHKVVHGFLALGAMLLTLGLFYLLPVEAVATAWAAEAVVLLALGYRYAHQPTRFIAHVVLACAVIRLLATRLPPDDLSANFIFNSWLLAFLVPPLGLFAVATVHRWFGVSVQDRCWQVSCWWLAGLATLLVGSGEIIRHAEGHPQAWILLPSPSLHGLWWTVGGMVYLASAWRWRSSTTAFLALFPVIIAVVMSLSAYALTWPGGSPVVNPRCMFALCTLAGLVAWLRVMSRSTDRLGDTANLRTVLLVMTQLGTILLATLETIAWFNRPLAEAAATSSLDTHLALTVVWVVLALAGVVAALASKREIIAHVSVLPLIAAVAGGFLLYARDSHAMTLVANGRFLAVVFAIVVVGCQRLVFQQNQWLATLTQALATAALTCELATWSHDYFHGDLAAAYGIWAVTLVWTGSAVIAALRWQRRAPANAWWLAAFLAAFASLSAMTDYSFTWDTWLPFVNLRIAAPATAVAALIMVGRAARQRPLPDSDGTSTGMWWYATIVGFITCTWEAPAHFLHSIPDHALASRVATFSVTVVWVVLAVAALTVGFRWRHRLVRYLALGLFALTAAKLVLVDMSGVQQIYRIISFMLVGVVLIGASYAYHRLERRFLTEPKSPEPPTTP